MTRITTSTWVGWLGVIFAVTAGGVFSVVVWAFSEFETRASALERTAIQMDRDSRLDRRLDRIECKLDLLAHPGAPLDCVNR